MSTSATAADDLVALAVDVAESASTGQMRWRPFKESSIARAEEVASCAGGITDEDATSMFVVRTMLDCYLRSAAEHTRAAAVLMGSDGSTMHLLPSPLSAESHANPQASRSGCPTPIWVGGIV